MKKIEVDEKLSGIIEAIEKAIPEDPEIKCDPEKEVSDVLRGAGFSQSDYMYWGKYLAEKSPAWMKNYLNNNSGISLRLSENWRNK